MAEIDNSNPSTLSPIIMLPRMTRACQLAKLIVCTYNNYCDYVIGWSKYRKDEVRSKRG